MAFWTTRRRSLTSSRADVNRESPVSSFFVVHAHLHRRFTGVGRHVVSVLPLLAEQVDSFVFGKVPGQLLPTISLRQIWSRGHAQILLWHAHRNIEILLGLLLRLLLPRVVVVVTRHSATLPSAWTRWLFSRADRVIALSWAGAEQLAGQLARQPVVIGHGVDLTQFYPPQDRAQDWAQLEQGGRLGIGVVGRVQPSKGPQDFVAAVASLLENDDSLRAVLVGLVKPQQQAWAEDLREQGGANLILAGAQEDVAAWYRGLSVVVMPSQSEGFGLSIIEAMACACCVVSTKLPHMDELIDAGRSGLLYAPGDVGALQDILQNLIENPQRRRELGAAAAKEARARFSLQAEVAALLSLYRELAGKAEGPES